MSQSSTLYRLQQIDSKLDQSRARLSEIDTVLNNNVLVMNAQNDAKVAEQAYQNARALLKIAEENTQDQRIKINQTESVLYGGKVKNPKELQDLQNHVVALKRYLSVLEDRQFEAMLSLESTEVIVKETNISLEQIRARVTEQQSGLRGEYTDILKNIERLEIERLAVVAAIQPGDLDTYEHLRQVRRGVAVSKVSSHACGACGSFLAPAVVQSASSPAQLVRCPSCGRILYTG